MTSTKNCQDCYVTASCHLLSFKIRYIVLEDSNDAKVYAAPMVHTIPCVGYVIEETLGKRKDSKLKVPISVCLLLFTCCTKTITLLYSLLQIDKVVDIIERNNAALKQQYSLTNAKQISKTLKDLKSGESFTFPDGTVVNADDILDANEPRKVVLLGDTSNARAIAPLAMGAHLLVHEATNAWFSESEIHKYVACHVVASPICTICRFWFTQCNL